MVTESSDSRRRVGLPIAPDTLSRFCDRNRIVRLSLFGSVLRGEERPDSDIDLLVEFERGCTPGYIALAGMEAELSVLLGGRRVDLRTPADLSRYFREDVMREAVLQHAR
jgi:predicted nucleotidyltransferase